VVPELIVIDNGDENQKAHAFLGFLFVFLLLCKLCFHVIKNGKSRKKCVVPLEPPPTQMDARSISTISAEANGRARNFSDAEMRRHVEDALNTIFKIGEDIRLAIFS
jgi:hypothetical protein